MSQNRTIFRALEILKYIANSQTAISLDDVCKQFDLPKSSAYVILSTLVSNGFLQSEQGAKITYSIGLTAYQVGLGYERNISYHDLMTKPLTTLANELNQTSFFAIPSDLEIIYLLKYEPENPILTTGRVGGTNPIHCTALGKAMLSCYDKKSLNDIFKRIVFDPKTKYSITCEEDLRKELELTKTRGYALDMRELSEFIVCISAPVFNSSGKLEGAISVSGLYNKNNDYEAFGLRVKQTADSISKKLGYIQ